MAIGYEKNLWEKYIMAVGDHHIDVTGTSTTTWRPPMNTRWLVLAAYGSGLRLGGMDVGDMNGNHRPVVDHTTYITQLSSITNGHYLAYVQVG